ncbi:MAG: site-specific DNA-methyltransferase [Candidatus Micrarchaeaceae archaeon]
MKNFQQLVKNIFVPTSSNIEFGIYRLLNYKRNRINNFIDHDLKNIIENTFTKYEINDDRQDQIYDNIYAFFSKYFKDGDFILNDDPDLNHNRYYIKTDMFFKDYTFNLGAYTVMFNIVSDKDKIILTENNKERFFVLADNDPIIITDKTITVNLQYRSLTNDDITYYNIEGKTNRSIQNNINKTICNNILNNSNINLKLDEILSQINKFINATIRYKDYFIYKDIKNFLLKQLDCFIKSKILNIDIENDLNIQIKTAKAIKEIGTEIINFISQIEEFQINQWEKKKFVISTEYVISIDKIPEELYDEILKNTNQLNEWEKLGFGKITDKKDLILKEDLLKKEYKKLTIDTKYFSQSFKDHLIELLTKTQDLDDILNGIVIKSENYQALNTIMPKYKNKIQTIYIDPPYNTGATKFIYNDKYNLLSWITMLENRLTLARNLMSKDGVIFISIGDSYKTTARITSTAYLQTICNSIYGEDNSIATFVRKSGTGPRQDIKYIANTHDYVLFYAKDINNVKINRKKASATKLKYKDSHFKDRGYFELRSLVKTRKSPTLYYPIIVDAGRNIEIFDGQHFEKKPAPERIEIWPDNQLTNKKWSFSWSKSKVDWGIDNDFIVFRNVNNKWTVYYKGYELVDNKDRQRERTNPYNTLILDLYNLLGASEIDDLFNDSIFDYPKPTELIKYLMKIGSNKNSLVLDFFAGSGATAHAVMNLNKEDNGNRKFILIEIGHHFDTVIIPRLKKIAYANNWKHGQPQDNDGTGIFFKYQIFEQYESTLNNIITDENNDIQDEIQFNNPFEYKRQVNLSKNDIPKYLTVDIPETFNYLLGIKVKKIKVRYNERKYMFVLGEKDNKNIAIVWRDGINDDDFIINEIKDWNPQIVYINGQNNLIVENWEIRNIEAEFKRLMNYDI